MLVPGVLGVVVGFGFRSGGGLQELFELPRPAFDVDRMAVIFGRSGGCAVGQVERTAFRILGNRRLFQREMRRAASFMRTGSAVSGKTHSPESQGLTKQ